MAHSVLHTLIIELNDNTLTVVILKKNQLVNDVKVYKEIDNDKLDKIMAGLPEIYSEIILLIRNKNFITIPESYTTTDVSQFFTLSYRLGENEKMWVDKSEQNIDIAYAIDTSLTDLIIAKFPRLKIRHEASVIVSKLLKEVNFKQARIFISINNKNLIILAINEGKLLLCNSYSVKSNDDIFYFVMLAIEQLQYVASETELIILGEPPNRAEMFDLFKNYINEINIWLEEYQTDKQVPSSESLLQSFALQTLICE